MEMFGKRLLHLRREKGLTQQQLGDIVGVGKVTISRYEHHSREADYVTLLRLAEYFDVSVDYILGRITMRRPWAEPPRHIRVDDLDEDRIRKAEDYVRLLRLERRFPDEENK